MTILTKELERLSYEKWKHEKKTANLSMNFAGAIQCAESNEKVQAKLKRIDSFLKKEPSKLQETNETLPELSTPVEEDFVDVTYRALSAAVLADRPVDFTNESMLKRATKLLNGQTVFKDHETSVDNWVGRVVETVWDTETEGIPNGINAKLRLDSVKDPMAVRGVLQGALHSASVTVSFEWKPSHPNLMEEGTFFQHLGETIDDEMVRVVVSKIEKFWEISLVWQGADEFAKQIGEDGKPVHQDLNPQDAEELSLSKTTINVNTEESNMKILETLKKVFGQEVTEESVEKIAGDFGASSFSKGVEKATAEFKVAEDASNKKISELTEQLNASNKKTEEAEAKVKSMQADAELGAKYLADERLEAIRLCKIAKGEKVSEAILKTLEKSELEVVQAWKAEFQKEVNEKFPSKCVKCDSTDISRQSSKPVNQVSEEKSLKIVGKETADKLQDFHS